MDQSLYCLLLGRFTQGGVTTLRSELSPTSPGPGIRGWEQAPLEPQTGHGKVGGWRGGSGKGEGKEGREVL